MAQNFPKDGDLPDFLARYSPWLSMLAQEHAAPLPMDEITVPPAKNMDTQSLMAHLRFRKRQAAYAIAHNDISGVWDDLTVMRHLSGFADSAVKACLCHLLLKAHENGDIKLPDPATPENGCSISIIALGKWGAHELNYSSDIDFMVLYDAQRTPVVDAEETQRFFVRLTRDLAAMLDQKTADGYVFRTDLRLRPDPGAMPLAVSVQTAENYYSTLGQNWERAAMIKARPVAGDAVTSADFMRIMNAWIWRRSLDFATIQDIHSIKRQINAKVAHKKREENPFLDFNVKLGHGGIREIEFFVQTQQLIYGGREPELRTPATLDALDALVTTKHVAPDTRDMLRAAYLFFRRVEHRLQMRDDRQTHSLPANADDFAEVTAFSGYENIDSFIHDLTQHTDNVRNFYAALFTESPSLSETGNLVFTGVDDDPETLETLKSMGFAAPEKVTSAVRGWHHGRYRAVRSERARQILTELIPHLLTALGKTAHPDDAFILFDRFLEKLPAGVPIFSLFARNPQLMALVAEIMGASPAMAEYLGQHPQVLDGVLSRDFFGSLPDRAWLTNALQNRLTATQDYQDVLDITRRFAHEKRFHAGIHILKNLSPDKDTARYLADIAEVTLASLVPHVEKEFSQTHGVIEGGTYMLLSLGSFGARQMYTDSDIDLVAIYESPDDAHSNGKKALPASTYYIRLTQRLLSALTAPTAEGVLYDVDMRLRPDGNKGPLAISLQGFIDYQKESAWAFEHMSLIRARPVYGPPNACKKLAAAIHHVLSIPRDKDALKSEITTMHTRVEKQFGTKSHWNLKYAPGGLMDIMFTAHYLMLTHATTDKTILHADIIDGLDALKASHKLSAKDHAVLTATYTQAKTAAGFLRLCHEQPFDEDTAAKGFKKALAQKMSGGTTSGLKTAASTLKRALKQSRAVYEKILGKA
ncbi:MAG: bifunctional [glutamine synthetase] adenylyltransferase/[glutamine synthetase]-adenylyl-L-tyrosine phosphorylase [Alphaproteobacteria bacterium]|nr:bifunctional [glutamine synthetase] adenylyltransferase/[glutamine synthetase]-adenylyl-L-tyrosine phosphorylase [Alphaproteobacteria bacterium]